MDSVVAVVLESRRYRRVAPDLVTRVAAEESAKHPRKAEAIKSTKRRLHQIVGAFGPEPPFADLLSRLHAAYAAGADDEIRAACRLALGCHASTRERLPILDRFYREVFAVTGQPTTLVDLGCGLAPLGLPWMSLPPEAEYHAYDVDILAASFLNGFFGLAGLPPLAEARDVVAHPPEAPADLALILKLLPTVEQQGGSPLRLLERVRARFLVVSYPVASLGGRDKGMPRNYEARFRDLIADREWPVERLAFETELVFVIDRGEAR